MPIAYILIGIPGSGKTTWAKSQDWFNNCVYISTDKFVEEYAHSQNKTYSEVFNEYMPTAVDLMVKEVVKARQESKNIIWDQTSTTIISRIKKFRMLPDYEHIAVTFNTPNEVELNYRLNNRPGKIIPNEVIKDMINKFEIPTEEEGYKEIWFVN
jgi:predicted kinase